MPSKRARPTKLRPKPAARDAKLPANRALKSAWDRLAARILDASTQGAEAFDELWEAAGEAVEHEPPLYVLGGYKTPKEFYTKLLHTDPRTAARNIRVAKYASPLDEETYGTTNLDAALAYLEAKHGPLNGRLPVAFGALKIPRGGKLVAFAKLTAAEIGQATRALHKPKTPAHAARAAYEKALAKHPAFKACASRSRRAR